MDPSFPKPGSDRCGLAYKGEASKQGGAPKKKNTRRGKRESKTLNKMGRKTARLGKRGHTTGFPQGGGVGKKEGYGSEAGPRRRRKGREGR